MKKVMTNTEFTEILLDIAQNKKTIYVLGGLGEPMTEESKRYDMERLAFNRKGNAKKRILNADAETFGFDCSCMIKAILWGWNGDLSHRWGGTVFPPEEGMFPDVPASRFMEVCEHVSDHFEEGLLKGEAVVLENHAGIYVGNGLVVESTRRWDAKVMITSLKRKKGMHSRKWQKHGRLPVIDYVDDIPC